MSFRKHLDRLSQRGLSEHHLERVPLRVSVPTRRCSANRDWLEDALDPFRELGTRGLTLLPDEEHNLFKIVPGQNTNGYRWVKPIGTRVHGRGRSTGRSSSSTRTSSRSRIRRSIGRRAPRDAADGAARRELGSQEELIDYLLTAGKKGLAIQRYKGLGEMNPNQLWDTTMDPGDAVCSASRSTTKSTPTRSSPSSWEIRSSHAETSSKRTPSRS